jgi:hypothetical protein
MLNERRRKCCGIDPDAGIVRDSRVAGADGQAPGAGWGLQEGLATTEQAAAELVLVAREARADFGPGGDESAADVVHGGECTEIVRGDVKGI